MDKRLKFCHFLNISELRIKLTIVIVQIGVIIHSFTVHCIKLAE